MASPKAASIAHALLCAVVTLTATPGATAQSGAVPSPVERYVSASIDAAHNLVIKTAGGETRVVEKGDTIDHFGAVHIAKDGTAVGVTAFTFECCQSYAIPTQVVVYAGGRVQRFDADGLSIEAWRFAERGKQIAMSATQHHLFCVHFYVLYDIGTGELRGESAEELKCPYIERPRRVRQPKWVRDLGADRKAWDR